MSEESGGVLWGDEFEHALHVAPERFAHTGIAAGTACSPFKPASPARVAPDLFAQRVPYVAWG